MNELDAMTTFTRVVETGSFSAAAVRLNTTQPSVSRRVSNLEAELGATLLLRSTRKLSLTEAGERYYAAARRALDAIAEARQVARTEHATVQGKLRVTAPISFSRAWLAPQLPHLLAEHPELELSLDLTERHVDLVEAGIDVGIRIGGPDTSSLIGRRVGAIHRHLVASRQWLDTHGPIDDPSDLASARGLAFAESGRWDGWPAERDGHPIHLRTRQALCGSSGDFLHALVLRGLGVTLLPDWLVADDMKAGRLVRLLPAVRFKPLTLWLVWPAQRFRSAAATLFCDWFAERAQARWHDSGPPAAQ